MNLLQLALQRNTPPTTRLSRNAFDDYVDSFSFNGHNYPLGLTQSWDPTKEQVDPHFVSYAQATMKRNGIVWAVNLKRQQLFSEARYGFRRLRNGRPAEMFGTEALSILEEPQPGVRTDTMNARMIQDVDLAGNSYLVRRRYGGRGTPVRTQLRRVRPDWCKIVLGSTEDIADGEDPTNFDLEPLYLLWYPGGNFENNDGVQTFMWDDVAHWAPYPDPGSPYLGMSWITPIIREIQADNAATTHKHKYWENAATPNLMVKLDIDDIIKFREWVEAFNKDHKGVDNAYKTLFLGAGADPTVIGSNMQQMDFANVAGVSENRIVIAGGLTATLLGTTEGLKGSSLNAGNYTASRRSTADTTLANLFRTACSSLQKVVDTPPDAELWYWAEDIPFLQEDQADAASIRSRDALTIESLIRGGFLPDTARDAVVSGDFTKLEHSGLVSVQLQPPGEDSGTVENPLE